jgi:hypothetical protein
MSRQSGKQLSLEAYNVFQYILHTIEKSFLFVDAKTKNEEKDQGQPKTPLNEGK